MLARHIKMADHTLDGNVVFLHQRPSQRGSPLQRGLRRHDPPVPLGIAHLNGKAVGIGTHAVKRPAPGLLTVRPLFAAHRPGGPGVLYGAVYFLVVHKVVRRRAHHIVPIIPGVVLRPVPVVARVMVDQIPNGRCTPRLSPVFGVAGKVDHTAQNIAHFSVLLNSLRVNPPLTLTGSPAPPARRRRPPRASPP